MTFRERREKLGISVSTYCKWTGWSRDAVLAWERNKPVPRDIRDRVLGGLSRAIEAKDGGDMTRARFMLFSSGKLAGHVSGNGRSVGLPPFLTLSVEEVRIHRGTITTPQFVKEDDPETLRESRGKRRFIARHKVPTPDNGVPGMTFEKRER